MQQVDAILQGNRHARSSNSRMQTPAPLKGPIFTDTGAAMTPTATKKRGKLYRYYVSMDAIKNRTTEEGSGGDQAPVRLPAGMRRNQWDHAVATEAKPVHPVGQPISASTNSGFKVRRTSQVCLAHQPDEGDGR